MKPVSVPFRSFAARASAFAGLSFAFCEDDAKKTDRRMIRPRDLPLYGSPESDGCDYVVPPPTDLEAGITKARESIRPYVSKVSEVAGSAVGQVTYAIATVRKPENDVLKYGSIALGVVVGSLLSYRRGIIRKLAYPTIGGLGTAAICYPDTYETVKQRAVAEGKELADVGVILAKQMYADLSKRISETTAATKPTEDSSKQMDAIGEQGRRVGQPSPVITFVPKPSKSTAPQVQGDLGQGNPDDRDLYTTRSS